MLRSLLFLSALAVLLLSSPLSAAEPPRDINEAIRRGIDYLKQHVGRNPKSGEAVLAALALVKAGESVDHSGVQAVLAAVQQRAAGEKYTPESHHYYTAGLELMLLEAVDPARYRDEMAKILDYIIAGQRESGSWYYPNQQGTGDTSITQYAMLGLWSADRAGLSVPKSVWDRAAMWHLRTQVQDGGFAYHPDERDWAGRSLPALTIGGAANLLLARMHLHRGAVEREAQRQTRASEELATKKFGVLQTVNLDAREEDRAAADAERNYTPQARQEAIQQSVQRAVNWSAVRFRLPPDTVWRMYYLYGLERLAALGDYQTLGPHDWYGQGAKWLLENQTPEGAWPDNGGALAGTAFGVMFLIRSTSQMLGRTQGVPELGGGLLAGGRGLPDDLSRANISGGAVQARPPAGPVDELLARLESADAADVPEVQAAVLEAVRFGDRENLIGQRERLRRLVDDPRVEVRRTAMWALGRGGELSDVPLLIRALSDPEPTVAIEAHNALCVLSRRPLAFGLSGNPLAELAEDAPQAEQDRVLVAWRQKAIQSWTEWYQRVAPYEERDGLGLFR